MLGKNQNIIKDAESFCKLAKQLNQQTIVTHVPTEEKEKYKDTNPFAESVPVNYIFKMHAMHSDGVNSHLWLNSSYYNDAEPASISLPKQVASGIVATGTAPTKPQPCAEKPFSYHDVVRITKGNFTGYYAIITETGDLSEKDVEDEIKINYLKKSFSKWVVAENLDSRKICEIIQVKATIAG